MVNRKIYQAAETIITAEGCQFQDASDLLAFATTNEIHILRLTSELTFSPIIDLEIHQPIVKLAWSPLSLSTLKDGVFETKVCIFGAFEDGSIQYFKGNTVKELTLNANKRRLGFCNGLAVEPHHGTLVASVGEDKFCRIWSVNDQECLIFPLESNGVSVEWNNVLENHLLIGESNGLIRIVDVSSEQPLFIVYIPLGNLHGVSWNQEDPNCFAAVARQNFYIWNLSQKPIHIPKVQGIAHLEGANGIRWNSDGQRFATFTNIPFAANQSVVVKQFLNIHQQVGKGYSLPEDGQIIDMFWVGDMLLVALNNKIVIL